MLRTFRFALAAFAFAFALSSCDQLRQVAVDQAGDFHENSEGSPEKPVPLALDVPHDGTVDESDSGRRETANSYYAFQTTSAGTYYCCVSNVSRNYAIYDRFKPTITVSASPSFSSPVFDNTTSFGEALVLAADTKYFIRVSNNDPYNDPSQGFSYSIAILSGDRGEGAPGSPVPIDSATAHAGVVGTQHGTSDASYYSFTAPTDGLYTWTLDHEDRSCKKTVYRDTAFTIKSSFTDTSAIPFATGETVFLKVESTSSANVPILFKNVVTRSGDRKSDGTEHNPVQLALDTPVAGKLGAKGISLYTFTTSTAGLYSCAVTESTSSNYYFSLYSLSTSPSGLYYQSMTGSGTYNLPANTAHYILIETEGSSPIAYTLKVSRAADATSEGYSTSPVPLQLDVPYAGKVGASNDGMGASWYSFTTGTAGAYAVKTIGSSSSLRFTLYSSPDLTSSVTCDTISSGIPGIMLAAATTYYLKIANVYNSPAQQYSLLVSRLGDALNEGSVASPVPLSLGVSHDGRVAEISTYNTSYYSFTAPATGVYDFTITNLTLYLDFYLYSDSAFSVAKTRSYNRTGLASQSLDAGTTYYFLVYNYDDSSLPCSYTLTVNKK